jgi:hypothetical protein
MIITCRQNTMLQLHVHTCRPERSKRKVNAYFYAVQIIGLHLVA